MTNERGGDLLRRDVEIFIVSALILYLELVLIRWIGTEIRVFAYLGNMILVVCFFGVGLGCYLAARPVMMLRAGVNLLLLLGLIANPFHIGALDMRRVTILLSGFEDMPIWQAAVGHTAVEVVSGLLMVAVLMYLAVFAFVPLGQILGRALDEHPRIVRGYSINIAGSLLGVWLFNAMSWASQPPAVWFAGCVVLLLPLCVGRGWPGWTAASLTAAAALFVWLGGEPDMRTIWSPYQKLTVRPFFAEKDSHRVEQGYLMEVNGTFYQFIVNLSPEFMNAHPEIFDAELSRRSDYNLPFAFKPHARRILIVGAGTGNNAAAALRHGVEQVDCVEIDPRIYALGRELHPERPYQSPRVRMVVDDARAFFKHATGPYDMIWFGWLDSHTLGSSYNNLRLDHYVYTAESFREASRLLADDGVIVVNFAAQQRWIADRLFVLCKQTFGREPLVYLAMPMPIYYGANGLTLVAARLPVTWESISDPELREDVKQHLYHLAGTTRPTTDDWPYLYLQRAKLPKLHLLTTITIIGAVLAVRRRMFGMTGKVDWPFFWLGAAFLLLEVQTVSRATLLFGMTWVVNAIVISAVLVMILAANAVAAWVPRFPQTAIVAGLVATVTALAVVPLDWFNTLSGASKLVAASVFLTAPVFFAGLIFIRAFAVSKDKAHALGSNLIGALVGGLLESLSFATGIRALVVLVGIFYGIALWRLPRR